VTIYNYKVNVISYSAKTITSTPIIRMQTVFALNKCIGLNTFYEGFPYR
jgi:hypothetical protein